MERHWLVLWISMACIFGGVLPQYRDKNIRFDMRFPKINIMALEKSDIRINKQGRDSDAVQEILARYLEKRLRGAQVFSPPPPSVLFNLNRQSRARKPEESSDQEADIDLNRTDSQEFREDYDDYVDDLQGFEDSEHSRTRINLFGKIRQLLTK